jgi:hypothetical protein
MALAKDQIKWLNSLGEAGAKAAKDAARRNKQANALAASSKVLDAERDKIRAALMEIQVEMEPEGFKENLLALLTRQNPKVSMLDANSDATKELDLGAHQSRQKIDPKDFSKILSVMTPIVVESEKLKQAVDDDGNPLFDPEDPKALSRMFWEPLVREGIIPENAVIDKHSEVARTFSGANELYDERLKEYSKDLTNSDKVLEYFDLPVAVAAGGLKIASSAEVMKGAIEAYGAGVTDLAKDATFKDVKERAAIIDGVAACLSSTKKAADSIIKKGDFQSAADAVIGAIGKVLVPTVGKETAKMVTDIATAAAHAAPITHAAVKQDMTEMLKQIGATIGDSLKASSSDPIFGEVGEVIKLQFEALAKITETGKDNSDAYTKMMQAALGVGTGAAQLIADKFKERALEELSEKKLPETESAREKDAINNLFGGISAGAKFTGDKGETAIEMPETLKALTEKASKSVDKNMLEALQKKAVEAQEEELQALLNAPDKEFEKVLAYGFIQDDEDPAGKGISEEMRLKSLENLIAEVQRQQKIYDLAKAIMTGGVASVEKYVPGLSTATAGTKTIFAFGEAIQKGRQMLVWFNNTKDAKAAVTVQYEAMMNRYGLQSAQTIVAGIQALIAAIDTIGKAMQIAGHLAPVGVAISAGAAGSEALLEVSVKVTTAKNMSDAWKVYKKALANPADRLAAREALRSNPTLAKYALAWGAVKDGNRIAQSALASCGIDEKSLASPGADEGKVVQYLETYFREDPKLLREVPVAEKWYPGDIELTVSSWVDFHKAAEDKASPTFKDKNSGNVTGRLHDLNAQLVTLSEVPKSDIEDKIRQSEYAVRASEDLISVLSRYKPLDKNGKPHETMTTYVTAFTEKARTQHEALKKGLADTRDLMVAKES